jgi:hypothetical protein
MLGPIPWIGQAAFHRSQNRGPIALKIACGRGSNISSIPEIKLAWYNCKKKSLNKIFVLVNE